LKTDFLRLSVVKFLSKSLRECTL